MINIARQCLKEALRQNSSGRITTTPTGLFNRGQFCHKLLGWSVSAKTSSGQTAKASFSSQSWSCRRHIGMPTAALSSVSPPFLSSQGIGRVSGTVFKRSQTGEAAVVDEDAYKAALPFDSIPTQGGLGSLPYIGPLLNFKPFTKYSFNEVGHIFNNLHDALGPIYRFRTGKEWSVLVARLEDAEIVLHSERGYPYREPLSLPEVYNKRSKKPVPSLIILNGPEWQRLRTSMNTRMNRPHSASHYLPVQEEVAVDFAHELHRLQDSPPAVLQDLFFKFATESVGVVCFNKRLNFLTKGTEPDPFAEKLLKAYKTIFLCITEDICGLHHLYRLYEDSFYKLYKEAKDLAVRFSVDCIKEALEEVARREREGTFNPQDPNFLLSLLAEKNLSEDDVLGIIDALMTAGSDSTACSLQLLFYNLATNPDKQDKLAEELLTHLGPDGHLNAFVLNKLVYLKAAVQESLRLHFPIPTGVSRVMPYNVVLSGYQIPQGTTVTVNNERIATSPAYFDHPTSYLPERWLRNEERQREKDIATMAYLPFGFGPRNCVGRRFALQELYLAAAKVLQHYHVGLKEGCPALETIYTPFLTSKHPLPFTVKPRH